MSEGNYTTMKHVGCNGCLVLSGHAADHMTMKHAECNGCLVLSGHAADL